MIIRILGAHNIESAETGFSAVLIDGILAVDAGALTSRLTFEEQKEIKAILLTHPHYDHIRDIPSIGMNLYLMEKSLDVYAPAPVWEALAAYLSNDKLYPDFTKKPEGRPVLRMKTIEPGRKDNIAGYEVLPVAVMHAVPACGYQVTSPDGKKVFITSDTGAGLADIWRQISPDLLMIELTLTNKDESFAYKAGHLTPALLRKELEAFYSLKKYLPRVVLVHWNPLIEKEIKGEIREVEMALKTKIDFSYEGMTIKI